MDDEIIRFNLCAIHRNDGVQRFERVRTAPILDVVQIERIINGKSKAAASGRCNDIRESRNRNAVSFGNI